MRTLVIWLVGIFIGVSINEVTKAIDRNTEAVKAANGIGDKK